MIDKITARWSIKAGIVSAFAFAVLVFVLLAAPLVILSPIAAKAQSKSDATDIYVAVSINDQPMDNILLDKRIALIGIMAGVSDEMLASPTVRKSLLQAVIAEEVQRQVVSRTGISLSPIEMQEGLDNFLRDYKGSQRELEIKLKAAGLGMHDLEERLNNSSTWARYALFVSRESLRPSENDIQAARDEILDTLSQRRYQYRELVIPLDARNAWQKSLQNVQGLIGRGVDFAVLAQNFSGSVSAASGGMIGPVIEADLPDNIRIELDRLENNKISSPIRTSKNIILLQRLSVLDPQILRTRSAVDYVSVDVSSGTEEAIADFRQRAADCRIAQLLARRNKWETKREGSDDLLRESEAYRALIGDAQTGETIEKNKGELIVICERENVISGLPRKQELENIIFQSRLARKTEQLSRQHTLEADIRIFPKPDDA